MAEPSGEIRRYHVHEPIGRGGFGTVYRAELLGAAGFTKIVAIKLLHPQVEADQRLLGRLRDEARILGLLRHRAIVQVDGLVRLAGRWALVMEFLPGVTLADARKACGPLPFGVALAIVGEVAGAIAAAWETVGPSGAPLHLLHRDIKPGNIQISRSGEVKLLDFGVARAQIPDRAGASQALVYGSVPYLAPERLLLRDGPEGDVFALGATLLEALSGRMSAVMADNAADHIRRVDGALALLAQRGPSPALAELVRSCLAFDPAERPTARDVEVACRSLQREIGGEELRDWADREIPTITVLPAPSPDDGLSGQILAESAGGIADSGPLAGVRRAETTFDDVVPGPEPAAVPPPAPPRRNGLRTLILGLFWLGVLGLVLTAAGGVLVTVSGMAGLAGVVAWMWPEMARQTCVEDFATIDAQLSATRSGRALDRVERYLRERAFGDCHAGRIGMWEEAGFATQIDNYTADGVITDFEASDLILSYDRIAAD